MSNKQNFSGLILATDLTTNVGTPLASGIGHYRDALSVTTNVGDRAKINSLIGSVITAMQDTNILAGQDPNAGIPPVSGSTVAFVNATVSILAADFDSPVQSDIDNAGAAGDAAYNSTSMSTPAKHSLQSGCAETMSALANYTAILGQTVGSSAPRTGGVK